MSTAVTFWGTRGTIPSPGPHTVRYGGNTACVEVRDGDGHVVILDAGTGIRGLGKRLIGEASEGLRAHIVLSHAHWDHIQGLPYFAPFFKAGNVITVWGPKQGDVGMEEILRQLMQPVVFPVPLDALAATLEVKHVNAEPIATEGCTISSMRVRHPAVTLGYRLEMAGGASVVYVTDDELGPGGRYDVGPKWRERFVRFIGGADVLIHDAMYTPEECAGHAGWGHFVVRGSGGAGAGVRGEAAGAVPPRARARRRGHGRHRGAGARPGRQGWLRPGDRRGRRRPADHALRPERATLFDGGGSV